MSQSQSTPIGNSQSAARAPKPAGRFKQISFLVVAGALAGIAATFVAKQTSLATPPTLSLVKKAEIGDAVLSLDRAMAAKAGEDAKECKAPLAFLTLKAAPNNLVVGVRVRSGSYLSPPLTLGDQPQRIALPLPAPYPVGHGEIVIEGAVRDVLVWLTPGITIGPQTGTNRINVVWSTANPCAP